MAPSDQFAKSAWMLASIAVVVGALYLAKGVLVPLAPAEAQEQVRLLIQPLLPPPEKQAQPDAGRAVVEEAHP
jgi:hypothetical protein